MTSLKYVLSTILFTTLLLTSCAPNVPREDYEVVITQNEVLENSLTEAMAELSDVESELSNTKFELKEANQEIERLSVTENLLAEKEQENDELQVKLDELQTDYNELKVDHDQVKKKSRELNRELSRYVCDEQLDNMKYENILDASTILSAWVANQDWSKKVRGTYRDTIWNNADTKLHGIRFISSNDNKEYVDHFVVFFNEFDMNEGVFWISGQCWLDLK